MDNLSKQLKKLESEVPGLSINLNTVLSKQVEDGCIVAFNDYDTLTCQHTFSEHSDTIWALEVYVLNDKQYMASASNTTTSQIYGT